MSTHLYLFAVVRLRVRMATIERIPSPPRSTEAALAVRRKGDHRPRTATTTAKDEVE